MAVLVLLVGGIPLVLTATIGNPLPGWRDLMAGDISDTAVLAVLASITWAAWAQFAASVVVEALAALLRAPLPGRIPGVMPGQQQLARILVVAVLALPSISVPITGMSELATVSAPPRSTGRPVAAAPLLMTAAGVAAPAASVSPVARPGASGHTVFLHTVTEDGPGTYWDLARAYLGAGERWQEIWHLNEDRRQDDGTLMSSPHLLRAGWRIRIPHTADDTAETDIAQKARETTAPGSTPGADSAGADAGRRTTYVVKRGDTLSQIARQQLGNGDLWPLICELNTDRRWPATGGVLRDCDLIYPGWELRLPATVNGPAADTEPRPARSERPHPRQDQPSTPSPLSTPVPSPSPARDSAQPPMTGGDTAESIADQDGVHLPGGYLPWTLACAIAAATALVWLQRRRRHVPGSTDDDPTDLPGSVLEISTQVASNTDLGTRPDLAERAADVPTPAPLPSSGLGLIGAGAHAGARAALVSALTSGGPRDRHHQGEVIIDRATLTALIGAAAAGLGPWPRLHVADHADQALTVLETQLLHRARILNENSLNDLDSRPEATPDEEPRPPILLISQTPPPAARMRAQSALNLGAGLETTAVLLGPWAQGATVSVDSDGYTDLVEGPPAAGIGERIAVLDIDTTLAILTTLREAHTGQPPAITAPRATPAPPASLEKASDLAVTDPPATSPTIGSVTSGVPHDGDLVPLPQPKARLSVFGTPRVEDVTAPGQPLRAKAGELAVFLACHRDGADTRTIGHYLEPDVRLHSADTRVHTNVSNLRHVMGRAAGRRKIGYVIKVDGQYRLDPTTVHVDLWEQRDLLARSATAPPAERIALLRRACDLYTGPLADGCDSGWVEAHREKARLQTTDAHLLLAENLLPLDPQAASDVLDRAIRLDRYNESLYRAAMHARHRLGDREGIRGLLQVLTTAMGDLDAEPDKSTIELAHRLRTQPTAHPTAEPDRNWHSDKGSTNPQTLAAVLIVLLIATGASLAFGIPDIIQTWRSDSLRPALTGSLLTLALTVALVLTGAKLLLADTWLRRREQPTDHAAIPIGRRRDVEELTQSRRLNAWARVVLIPVAAIGAVLSFRSLYEAAEPTFGPYLAAGFPALVDLLILGSSLQYVSGAKIGYPLTGWRVTAHAGVAATLTLNALAADKAGDVPWHITAPAVWAILVELTAKQVLGQWKATHTARLDTIPLSLWLSAPIESGRTRLHMLRTGTSNARTARIGVGMNAAAREAVRLALPTSREHRTRKIIYRQLRAGSLTPTAILHPLGWTDASPTFSNHRPNVMLLAAVLHGVLNPHTNPHVPAGPTVPDRSEHSSDVNTPARPKGPDSDGPPTPQSDVISGVHPDPASTIHNTRDGRESGESGERQDVDKPQKPEPDPPVFILGPNNLKQADETRRPDHTPVSVISAQSSKESEEHRDDDRTEGAVNSNEGESGGRRRGVDERRLGDATSIVRQRPTISGIDLATALGQRGWSVSPRTAQRLLRQIQTMPKPVAPGLQGGLLAGWVKADSDSRVAGL